MPNQELKKSLMYRVYMVYLTRKLLNPRGLSLGWLILGTFSLLWLVSILNVARNFWASTNDFGSAYGFVTTTFSNTSLIVQTISVGILAVTIFFAVDLYRTYLYTR